MELTIIRAQIIMDAIIMASITIAILKDFMEADAEAAQAAAFAQGANAVALDISLRFINEVLIAFAPFGKSLCEIVYQFNRRKG